MRRNLVSFCCFFFLCAFPGPCTTFDDVNPQEDASADVDNNRDNGSDAPNGFDAVTRVDAATETDERDGAADRAPDSAQNDELRREAVVVCARSFDCPGLQEAVLASVGFPLSNNNYALCLHWALNPFGVGPIDYHQAQIEMLECIASAADCEGALACTYVRLLDIDDPLCEGYPQSLEGARCDEFGNAVIECPGRWRRCDSPLYSEQGRCQQGEDLLGAPVARCVIDTPCRAGLGSGYCNEHWAINCDMDLNLYSVTNCAITGRTCIEQATGATCISAVGNLQCVFTAFPGTYAAEVLRAGSSACVPDSNAVAICDGEQFATFDCGSPDEYQCQDQDYPPWAWCAPAQAACAPTTIGGEAAVCNDDQLIACVGGQSVKVDCSRFEMRCEPGTLTRSAYCTL